MIFAVVATLFCALFTPAVSVASSCSMAATTLLSCHSNAPGNRSEPKIGCMSSAAALYTDCDSLAEALSNWSDFVDFAAPGADEKTAILHAYMNALRVDYDDVAATECRAAIERLDAFIRPAASDSLGSWWILDSLANSECSHAPPYLGEICSNVRYVPKRETGLISGRICDGSNFTAFAPPSFDSAGRRERQSITVSGSSGTFVLYSFSGQSQEFAVGTSATRIQAWLSSMGVGRFDVSVRNSRPGSDSDSSSDDSDSSSDDSDSSSDDSDSSDDAMHSGSITYFVTFPESVGNANTIYGYSVYWSVNVWVSTIVDGGEPADVVSPFVLCGVTAANSFSTIRTCKLWNESTCRGSLTRLMACAMSAADGSACETVASYVQPGYCSGYPWRRFLQAMFPTMPEYVRRATIAAQQAALATSGPACASALPNVRRNSFGLLLTSVCPNMDRTTNNCTAPVASVVGGLSYYMLDTMNSDRYTSLSYTCPAV